MLLILVLYLGLRQSRSCSDLQLSHSGGSLLRPQKDYGGIGVVAIDRHESIGVAAVMLQRN